MITFARPLTKKGIFYMDKLSYALGLGIGRQLLQMGTANLNVADFAAAITDVLRNNTLKMTNREAQQIVTAYFATQETKLNAERAESGKTAKAGGELFLAENAKKEGVTVTASGLQYKVLKEGTGRQPKATDSVKCHYEGFLTDGTLFDSSIQRNEPAVFSLQQVITGWTEGLQLMKEGAKYRFFMPYKLGYGESGAGRTIPPYAALVFDIELIEVM